jgi:predicted RNase H-like nuclease (RuvC/YqgF family)
MPKRSADDFDDDNTDELPVLLDTVGLEDAVEPELAAARPDDTADRPRRNGPAADTPDSRSEPELAEPMPALRTQIRALTEGTRDLERQLREKDKRIEELDATLASLRQSTDDSTATEKRLATQLAVRDARLAELTAVVERLEQAAADSVTEIERLRALAESRATEAEALRRELDARPVPDSAPPGDDLREEHAALRSYVATRRAWWDEMQATNARLAARVTALEEELAASSKGLAAAEAFAARESSRAVGLRAELVDYARRVDALERELRLLRTPELEPRAPAGGANAHGSVTAPNATLAGLGDALAREAPVPTDVVDAMSSAVDAIAQLEAEVEYKRQQVAAQLVELRDREQQLRTATSEVGALRTELDESRAKVSRLERTVADKDRALESRDARIATLHDELKQRIAEKRGAADFSQTANHSAQAQRTSSHGAGADPTAAPALICLTGDAPKRFALTKQTVTVGRGPHCDLQIITHFVSREHARLTVSGDATLIEDLGSRNGVFVNSVRVDRRQLQQGDLVTIGETQFRFVESMAH